MTLKQFKKNNLARREIIAKKTGYSSVQEYIDYLTSLENTEEKLMY